MARIREMGENWPFIYMGENEMKFNLSLSVVGKKKKEGFKSCQCREKLV